MLGFEYIKGRTGLPPIEAALSAEVRIGSQVTSWFLIMNSKPYIKHGSFSLETWLLVNYTRVVALSSVPPQRLQPPLQGFQGGYNSREVTLGTSTECFKHVSRWAPLMTMNCGRLPDWFNRLRRNRP